MFYTPQPQHLFKLFLSKIHSLCKLDDLIGNQDTFFLCVSVKSDPAAPADSRPDSDPEPATDDSPAGPFPAELGPNQRHHWRRRSHRGWGSAAQSGSGSTQQETSARALWSFLRHRGFTVRIPGKFCWFLGLMVSAFSHFKNFEDPLLWKLCF